MPADKREHIEIIKGSDAPAKEGGQRIFRALRPDQPPAASSPSTPTYTDMDFRKPFSKQFKKLKYRLTEGDRKRDGRSGKEGDRGGSETGIDGGEASQRNSRLRSDVDDVVERAPSREGNPDDVTGKKVDRVDSSASPPPISHGAGESGSTQTTCYSILASDHFPGQRRQPRHSQSCPRIPPSYPERTESSKRGWV